MKPNLLKQGLFNACALTVLLLPAVVQAQDKYWLLQTGASQSNATYLNTVTRTVNTYAGLPGYYAGAHVRTVFDASGNEVFSYGTVETTQSNTSITQGGNQAFRIPGKCKQYYLMTVTRNAAHVGIVTLTLIDASGTGLPVAGNGIGLTQLGAFHYGAVAARPEPDGKRYIYCLSADDNNTTVCNLVRFTIQTNGSFGPSNVYTTIRTNLPLCPENVRMKMAPDGNSLGYTDVNGQLVTVRDLTTPTPTVTSYSKTALGMAEITVNNVRRWYVSTGTELGYFTEGNGTTFTTISNSTTGSYGINSDIAQSADGTVYVAKGNPSIGAGALAYFDPNITSPVFNTISGTQISGVNDVNTPTAYSFGSNVEGEDNNVSQPAASLSNLTLNNIAGGTVTAPDSIWVCNGATSLQLKATISPYSSYYFSWQYGTLTNGVFTGSLLYYGQVSGPAPFSSYNVPYNPASTRNVIKITFIVNGVCGDQISQTRYYVIKPISILVNFKMIGPNDVFGSAVCPGGRQNRYNVTTFQSIGAVTSPSCWPGWLGAYTVGIASPALSGGTSQGTTPLKITVREYDSNMTFIKTIINTNYITIPLTYPFNQPNNGLYFYNNYNTIKNNNIYEVIVGILSNECGMITDSSYFKIIDGGLAGSSGAPESWKAVPRSQDDNLQSAEVFPNPVSTTLSMTIPAGATQASVKLMDNMGRLVAENEHLQIGKNSIDVQRLPAGVYFYNLSVNGKMQHGKIVKQ